MALSLRSFGWSLLVVVGVGGCAGEEGEGAGVAAETAGAAGAKQGAGAGGGGASSAGGGGGGLGGSGGTGSVGGGGTGGTGGAPDVAGAAGAAGAKGLEVEPAMFTVADAPLAAVMDGDAVPLMFPPQGGYVLFVGARLRNVSTGTIKIHARLLNPESGALVAEDLRTVVIQPVPGEAGVFMTDNRTYSQHANITLCPDWSDRAIDGASHTLEVTVTELYVDAAVPVTVTRSVVPTCAAGPSGDECRCSCAANFVLGKCN